MMVKGEERKTEMDSGATQEVKSAILCWLISWECDSEKGGMKTSWVSGLGIWVDGIVFRKKRTKADLQMGRQWLKWSRTLRGPPRDRSFLCLPFAVYKRQVLHSLVHLSLSSKGQIQTVANPRRKGMWRQGRNGQSTIEQLWSKVLLPH